MVNPPADMPSGLVIFAIGVVVMTLFVLFLWAVNTLPQKVRAIMSRPAPADGAKKPAELVHVPVPPTSTEARTSDSAPSGTEGAAPDTDALEAGTEGWEMPRISRRLSDAEMIAMLAVQRTSAGKLRYSANAIAALVGGSRAEVLAQVRAIREGPAEFRPLSPEQQTARQALGLNGQQKSETV